MTGRATWARRADVVFGVLLIALVLLAIPAVRGFRLSSPQADVAESSVTPSPDDAVALERVRETSDLRIPFTADREPVATPSPTPEATPEPVPVATDDLSFENPPPPPPPLDPTAPPAPTQPPGVLTTPPPPAPTRTPLVALPGETIHEDEYFAEVHKSGRFGSTITIREVTVTASRLPAGEFGLCPMENPPPGMHASGYEITVTWSDVYMSSLWIQPSAEASFWCSEGEGAGGLISGRPDRYWIFQYPGETLTMAVNPNNTYISYWWHWTD